MYTTFQSLFYLSLTTNYYIHWFAKEPFGHATQESLTPDVISKWQTNPITTKNELNALLAIDHKDFIAAACVMPWKKTHANSVLLWFTWCSCLHTNFVPNFGSSLLIGYTRVRKQSIKC